MGFGVGEIFLFIALIISIIWVVFDAPKHGINRYIAALAILILIYPIGFIGYLIMTRVIGRK